MDSLLRGAVLNTLAKLRKPLNERARERLIEASDASLRVNIGAGKQRLPGWINTDLHWQAEAYLDLLSAWPSSMRGRVEYIYGDNVIEHFRIPKVRLLLRYAFDALEPGGIIRLATPDVRRAAAAYLEASDLAIRHLSRHHDAGYDVYYPVDLLRVIFAESGHHTGFCFDFESLSGELLRAGFSNVMRCEPGESESAAFRGLENRRFDTDAVMSLVVEGTKR